MDKIINFFEQENFSALEKHLGKMTPAELCNCFKTCSRRHADETPKLLTAFFRGLSSSTAEGVKRRQAIYCEVVHHLQKGSFSTSLETKLTGTLLLETREFPPDCLASLAELFIESFKSGEHGPGKWLEVFPQLLSWLTTHEKVPYVDGHMTGAEYKSHAVNTICAGRWPSNLVVGLATVFKNINLSLSELKYVLDKIMRTLQDVEYDSIPPLVYQTLLLSLKGHKRLVLEGLITFFNEEEAKCRKLESNKVVESDLESVEESCKLDELHRCKGTVLLHVLYAIKNDRKLGLELVKILQINRCMPEKIISPFILSLALCVASEEQFQQPIFDHLKATLMRSHKEKTLRRNSNWVREILHINTSTCIEDEIHQTISVSAKGWDHVTQGLVKFGFSLLDQHGPKLAMTKDNSSPSAMACTVGTDIIINVFKENRTVRGAIISEILNRIVPANPSLVKQYLVLLAKTINHSHQAYFDCINKVRQVLDYLVYFPASLASELLNAIQPLLTSNSALRDAVIVLLHKAMFSRQLESRKIAVIGFLSCLKHFRIMGALPNSQGSQILGISSQFSADVHVPMKSATNEALCHEVLGMLRRAFTQQADVRTLLYHGFPDIISTSPYLIDMVLELLQSQACLFMEPREVPPLHLQKCFKIQGNEVIYLEPMPDLLGCIHKCAEIAKLRMASERDSEDMFSGEPWSHPLRALMDELNDAMIKADLVDFELDKAADYSIANSVGAKNYLMASIVLGIYETLMEYSFLKCNNSSTEIAENVLKLFEKFNKLLGIIKAKPGKGKAKGKAKKKEDKVSVGNRTTAVSTNFITTTVKALFLDNLPNDQEALSPLRDHSEFQLYLLTVALEKVTQLKDSGSFENEDQIPEKQLQYCCIVGRLFFVLFCNELSSDEAKLPSEIVLIQKCLDGFATTIVLVEEKFGEKFPTFLSSLLVNTPRSGTSQLPEAYLDGVIKRIMRLITKLLSAENMAKKYKEVGPLIKAMSVLIDQLPVTSQAFKTVHDWIERLCTERNIDDVTTVKSLLSLFLKVNVQMQTHLQVLTRLAQDALHILGDLDQSRNADTDGVTYSLVNEETASVVVALILDHLDVFFGNIEWVVANMKEKCIADDKDIMNAEKREAQEKCICSAFASVAACLHQILSTTLPQGPVIESALLRSGKLYFILAEFTKYFLQIAAKGQMICPYFEKLVTKIHTNITRRVSDFVTFYQQKDGDDGGRGQVKNKGRSSNASKALKESKMMAQIVEKIEHFECNIIKLSTKTKNTNLTAKMKPNTNRDFRIIVETVDKALDQQAAESDDDENRSDEESENVDEGREPEERAQTDGPESKRPRLLNRGKRMNKKLAAPVTSHI